MTTDSEIYARAADLLGEGGHCKGNLRTDEGQRCALGALRDAEADLCTGDYLVRYHGLGNRAANRLMARDDDTLGLEVEDRERNPYNLAAIAYWNDLPETTSEEVIMLFKELAHEAH